MKPSEIEDMKKPSRTEFKKSPASKGQSETKPTEVTNVGQQDVKTTALPSQPEPSANQPTATELAQLAVTLARTRYESVTPENREGLLRDAYDLWCNAGQVIQTRQKAHVASDSKSWSDPEIIAAFSDDPITFKEIVEKRLAPKLVGTKGVTNQSSGSLGMKGVIKSIEKFLVESFHLPAAWLPSTKAKFGSRAYSKALKEQFPGAANEYRMKILREKVLPRPLFHDWLTWRRKTLAMQAVDPLHEALEKEKKQARDEAIKKQKEDWQKERKRLDKIVRRIRLKKKSHL